ncbi:MAG TPA: NlpC/P60 family protein [Nakamurella sp.]
MLGNLLRVKLVAVLMPVILVVGVVVFGATAFVGITGSTSAANAQENPCGASPAVAAGQAAPVGGTAPGLSPLQQQNVQTIVGVAIARKLGKAGILVMLTASYTESSWNNRAVDPSGRWFGLYQMSPAWLANEADRYDPVKSSHTFIDGGESAGTPGLLDIPQWWTLDPAWAAEEVEQYGHDGDNYRVNIPIARAVMDSVLAGQDVPELPDESVRAAGAAGPIEPSSAPTGQPATAATPTCTPAGPGGSLPNTVVANGVSVQIPAGLPTTYVAAAVAGKTIQAPTAGLARGLAAGFGALGMPYVWGGGGSGAGPNNGCQRGGGDNNSCGSEIGFDCSGLTAYVLGQAGFMGAPGSSGEQRTSGQSVPYEEGLPGDIVGFPGHVAVYLGVIDGTPYILEASWVGTPIHIVPLTRSDRDGSLHRLWS